MITLEEVAAYLADLPGVTVGERWGRTTWFVGKKHFAWERPFSKADLKRFGDAPVPTDPILAVTTGDLHEKEAVLAGGLPGFFTIPHFDGFAAVLIELRVAHKKAVKEALLDGWQAVAPADIAAGYPEGR
jgi:hypothetical protein